ncbi:MAG: YfcE family phosphodiesterase [bacterium]
MKIAVISDSHDNVANLKRVYSIIKKEKIKIIIHCGDIASIETLKEVFGKFKGKIYASLGNMDKERDFSIKKDPKLPQLKVYSNYGSIRNIAFTHSRETARKLSETKKYDLVFYGHTHKPWEEKIGKTKMVNPGNVAGITYRATFAIYDNDKLKLVIL